jgi:hypothetical protein
MGSRRSVGIHAIGFFYADPEDKTRDVRAATRLFFDDPAIASLPELLAALCDLARDYATVSFEPRVHMCNRVESMSSSVELLGIGATTVLPPRQEVIGSPYAVLGLNRPYQGVAQLLDGTRLLLRSAGNLERVSVKSSQTLNINGVVTRHWAPLLPPEMADNALSRTFELLDILLNLTAGIGWSEANVVETCHRTVHRRSRRGNRGLLLRGSR